MWLFCLLWTPLLYFFWSALTPEQGAGGRGIAALVLGSVTGGTKFFLGAFVEPEGFSVSRWVSGFVDMVSAPVLLPFAVYMLLLPLKGTRNFGSFALLWLIPDIGIRLAGWNVQNNPLLLVLVPVLQTAIALGLASCLRLMGTKKIGGVFLGFLGICAVPLAGATSYWAFFSQNPFLGRIFFGLTVFPGIAGLLVLLFRTRKV
ncbi:MAG: hypothetical protein LBG90_06390 [Spirochaetaceae bacterium]|jgi:hypothetical protein|nr:hypothetical protein [Spirochaetaceae bacterium]